MNSILPHRLFLNCGHRTGTFQPALRRRVSKRRLGGNHEER